MSLEFSSLLNRFSSSFPLAFPVPFLRVTSKKLAIAGTPGAGDGSLVMRSATPTRNSFVPSRSVSIVLRPAFENPSPTVLQVSFSRNLSCVTRALSVTFWKNDATDDAPLSNEGATFVRHPSCASRNPLTVEGAITSLNVIFTEFPKPFTRAVTGFKCLNTSGSADPLAVEALGASPSSFVGRFSVGRSEVSDP